MNDNYLKLTTWIKTKISDGSFQINQRIPTEDKLCSTFSYSKYTVRKAIDCLVKEGLLTKKQGSGTFVSDRASLLTSYPQITKNDSKIIDLILVNTQTYIFPEVLKGISECLLKYGYFVRLTLTDNDCLIERKALKNALDTYSSGIILEPVQSESIRYNYDLYTIVSNTIPTIMIHDELTGICPFLSLKDRYGTRLLLKELIKKGHKKIGSIYCLNEPTSKTRYLGMLDELFENNIEAVEKYNLWVRRKYVSDIFKSNGNIALERMLEDVTAIVCHDDRIAFDTIKYLSTKNIRVPEDISIVGYDNIEYNNDTGIKLTTIEHPKRHYGYNAALALINLIKNPNNTNLSKFEIEPKLILGNSISECVKESL